MSDIVDLWNTTTQSKKEPVKEPVDKPEKAPVAPFEKRSEGTGKATPRAEPRQRQVPIPRNPVPQTQPRATVKPTVSTERPRVEPRTEPPRQQEVYTKPLERKPSILQPKVSATPATPKATTQKTTKKVTKPKKKGRPAVGLLPYDYVEKERKEGHGFGITGIGRMLQWENGGYVARVNNQQARTDTTRSPSVTPKMCKDDVSEMATVRLPTPLLEYVSQTWVERIGLKAGESLNNTDLVVFLLLNSISNDLVKDVLVEVLSDRYSRVDAMASFVESESSEESQMAYLQSGLQSVLSEMEGLRASNTAMMNTQKSMRQENIQLMTSMHGVGRMNSLMVAAQTGLLASFPQTTDEVSTALFSDAVLRVTQLQNEAGEDERVRQRTRLQSAMRKEKK